MAIGETAKAIPQMMGHTEAMQHHQGRSLSGAVQPDGGWIERLRAAVGHRVLRWHIVWRGDCMSGASD